MKTLRTCTSSNLYTGGSKCPPDLKEVVAAILVEPGKKLPADITLEKLEELAHADRPDRIYIIRTFGEYAPEGNEVQTSAVGYGPEKVTGISARKDSFTPLDYSPELDAALTRCKKKAWDVYYVDKDGTFFGLTDGTDVLAGYPMASVYSNATPFKTSSADATQTVVFSHKDAEKARTQYDYSANNLDITSETYELALTPVKLVKTDESGNEYKLIEAIGGYDLTPIYGDLIAKAGETVVDGASAVSYNTDKQTLTITAEGTPKLKAASVLYENDIKGIEEV